MSLKLMYITNRPDIAQIAESSGVDRIFVDMEYIGKADRQGGLDSVQNHHTVEDVRNIKQAVQSAEVLVRVNPIHPASTEYCSSEQEIDDVIRAGADIIMLPYITDVSQVKEFLRLVGGRAKTMPLIETPKAVEQIDEILSLDGIDEIYIGLNDLSLGYHMKFMFELLANGTVEELCLKSKLHGIPYGFGGIASLGKGMLPSEYIIREHYRLGSTCAILSRSFCNVDKVQHIGIISSTFIDGVKAIRELEEECESRMSYFRMGHEVVFMQYEKDALPCEYEWVEGVICNGLFLSHPIEKFPNLRYIQLTSAGFDRVDLDYVKVHGIEIHNARGVYSIPMAEFAICGVLQLYKQSAFFREDQRQHLWEKHRGLLELSGKTVLIVGCGSVGNECAKRFSAFGCQVIGVDLFPREDGMYREILPLEQLD